MSTSRKFRAAMSHSAVSVSALLVAAVWTGGCESTGLSPREAEGNGYANFLSSLPNEPLTDGAGSTSLPQPPRPLVLPAKIAVAQVGEVAPPQKLLDMLHQDSKTWSLVSPVDGRVQFQDMRRYARDIGADYLFVFGGTVDRSDNDTGLALANATIIGAFIVPSKQIDAEGTGAGSLIDLPTGRVVLSVSADDHERRLSAAASAQADEVALLESLRDKLVAHLGQRLIDQAQSVAKTK